MDLQKMTKKELINQVEEGRKGMKTLEDRVRKQQKTIAEMR